MRLEEKGVPQGSISSRNGGSLPQIIPFSFDGVVSDDIFKLIIGYIYGELCFVDSLNLMW
jgi:hypothetical protein